jgi:hypothetical protein
MAAEALTEETVAPGLPLLLRAAGGKTPSVSGTHPSDGELQL